MSVTAEKFQKFKPRKGSVNAYQHTGSPEQVNTEDGTETVYAGQFVVQVGEIEHTQVVPPKDGKPGTTRTTKVPKLEIMDAEDFLGLYEPA